VIQDSLILRSRDRSAKAENMRRSVERKELNIESIENIEKIENIKRVESIERTENIEKVENVDSSTQREFSRFEHVLMKTTIAHNEMMSFHIERVINKIVANENDRAIEIVKKEILLNDETKNQAITS
jgi:hypothetical protein